MAVCEVYSHPVKLKYKSTLCSKSTIFSVITTFLTFLLPLLIAYRSQGFWLRNSEYREQPDVHFKYSYFLYLETDKPDQPILCSNLPISKEFDYCSMIKSREEDINRDGKHDELILEIQVDPPPDVGVYTVQLVLFFDYILQKRCLLQMEAMAVIQYNSGVPGYNFHVTGDLGLVQKQLLNTRGRDLRYNQSVFVVDEDSSVEFNFNRIIKNYSKRNISTKLKNSYKMWTSGVLLDEPFMINVNIQYPEDTVKYKPGFWEVMKWAWIQYFSLLFIFFNVFQRVKGYVFCNHLIPIMKEIPWKKIV